ncbi:hypothetical protein L1887_23962 [Cichorium endivia]|nr:hypothetical protein L1887_23962 [Cichorium endivia]
MVSCWMLMWVDGFYRRRMPDYYVDVGEDPVRKSCQQDVGLVYIYGKGWDRKLLVSQAMNSGYEHNYSVEWPRVCYDVVSHVKGNHSFPFHSSIEVLHAF